MVLVDTNVIIEAFKGAQETIELLERIGLKNLVVSTITQMELYIGAAGVCLPLQVRARHHDQFN